MTFMIIGNELLYKRQRRLLVYDCRSGWDINNRISACSI